MHLLSLHSLLPHTSRPRSFLVMGRKPSGGRGFGVQGLGFRYLPADGEELEKVSLFSCSTVAICPQWQATPCKMVSRGTSQSPASQNGWQSTRNQRGGVCVCIARTQPATLRRLRKDPNRVPGTAEVAPTKSPCNAGRWNAGRCLKYCPRTPPITDGPVRRSGELQVATILTLTRFARALHPREWRPSGKGVHSRTMLQLHFGCEEVQVGLLSSGDQELPVEVQKMITLAIARPFRNKFASF